MGQAPDDLPDPVNSSALGTATSADDLLAQLAGEEIDRLLADESLGEMEGEAAESTPAPAPPLPGLKTAPATVEEPDPDTARQLDDLFAQLVATEPAVPESVLRPAPARPPSPSPGAEAADAALSQQLDDLFAQLQADQAAATTSSQPTPTPPVAPPAPVQAAVPAEAPPATAKEAVDPADQTSDLERQVLAADLLEPQEPAGDTPAEDEPADERPAEPRVPFYVRLLELINAPLANASEAVRDVLGKAAIVTLVNALLILMYVLFVRGQ